jgi:hypothetical protein
MSASIRAIARSYTRQNSDNTYDVYLKHFSAFGEVQEPELIVNSTRDGNQMYSGVSMNDKGNIVVAWSHQNQDGSWDIDAQQYLDDEATDRVGPIVAGVYFSDGTSSGASSPQSISQLRVVFSEPMNSASVTDLSNWRFKQENDDRSSLIHNISYTLNALNQPEAIISFYSPLSVGKYSLEILDGIRSQDGDALDGDTDGIPGGYYTRSLNVDVLLTGSEKQVNTQSLGNQQTSEFTPQSVGTAPNGSYIITWSSQEQDGSGWGVFARRFAADGTPLGNEFRVNTTTTNDQQHSAVAVDAKGNFVITWTDSGRDGSSDGIYAQRYDALGNPLGGQFQVNTYTSYDQSYPAIATDVEGNFVITWSSYHQDGYWWGVYAQRFNAQGVAQGLEFRVNTTTSYSQLYPAVASDADGNFIITWSSQSQDSSGYGIYAKRFDKQGKPLDQEFRVNTITSNNQVYSRVAADRAGNFVITWEGQSPNGAGYDIYARRYTSAGIAPNPEFVVNQAVAKDQRHTMISMDAEGNFVITWSSEGQDSSGWSIYAQRFSAEGARQGDEFRVNTTTTRDQRYSAVGLDNDGNFVIAWNNLSADSSWDIKARRYQANAAPVVTYEIPDQRIIEGTAFNFTFAANTFTDAGEDDRLTYTATLSDGAPLPAWLTFDVQFRTFSGTPDYADVSSFRIKVTATDLQGASISDTFNLVVALKPVDLEVLQVNAPSTALLGEAITVAWTVKNQGSETALSDWKDAVYISDKPFLDSSAIRVADQSITVQTPLEKDGEYTISQKQITIPKILLPGRYYLLVAADDTLTHTNRQPEANETNNVTYQEIQIESLDLVTQITTALPDPIIAGSTVSLNWTVTNQGTATVPGHWMDRLYLSSDTEISYGEQPFAQYIWTADALSNNSRQGTHNLQLPIDRSGNYHLIVSTVYLDNNGVVYETDTANNKAVLPIRINSAPYADLSVSNVSVTPQTQVANPANITVNWTVTNQGTGTGNVDTWIDRIIASTDAILGNGDDQILKEFTHIGFLNPENPNQNYYSRSETFALHSGFEGKYHLFVQTDAPGQNRPTGAIYENGQESNNSAIAPNPFIIARAPYADLTVSSVGINGNAASGQSLTLSWQVQNQGTTITSQNQWYDWVQLVEAKPGGQVYNLGNFERVSPLAAGGDYLRSADVILPNGISGTYYLTVRTGVANEFFFTDNNTGASAPFSITLSPSPNLIVTDIQAPEQTKAGETIDLTWSVKNDGHADALQPWTDQISLVGNDGTIIPLKSFTYTPGLGNGFFYDRTERIPLPANLQGSYRVAVTTNTTKSLYEHGSFATDNTRLDDRILEIQYPTLPDLTVTINPPSHSHQQRHRSKPSL